MPHSHFTTRSLPFLTNFLTKDRQAAERAFGKQEEQRRKTHESRAQQADQLAEGVQRQLHGLLGARKFAQLREGIQRERLALRDLFQPPQGLKRDYAKQHKASKQRIDALLRKLGASRQKLRRIVGAAEAKLEALLIPDDRKVVPGFNLPDNLSKWTKLSPLHKFPLPWGWGQLEEDPNDPHRWFLFRPPFFGFLFSHDIVTTGDFRADCLLHLDPPAGLVGNECTMDLDDAGDWNVADVIGEAQIAFAFTAPVAGLVEVLIDAQSTIGTHSLSIEDEFGFSNAWCNQHNYLMMNVLHPNVLEPSLALMSTMSRQTGGDDLSASQSNLTRGQHYFAQLFSSGPVPAGQSVIITVGTRSFDICYSNDMELHSRTNFQWFISSVEVRIAP
jgi:hypothetical protein